MVATLLVCQRAGVAGYTLPLSLDAARQSLDEASKALSRLDNGNKMVEKCGSYLEQLGHVLRSLSKSSSVSLNILAWALLMQKRSSSCHCFDPYRWLTALKLLPTFPPVHISL